MVSYILIIMGIFFGLLVCLAWKNPKPFYSYGRSRIWLQILGEEGARKLTLYLGVPLGALFAIGFIVMGIFS